MKSSISRGAVVVAASALLAAAFGVNQGRAQSGNAPAKTEKADKQKSTEKKNAAKQGAAQTTNQPAPMSGFRPDPQTNY